MSQSKYFVKPEPVSRFFGPPKLLYRVYENIMGLGVEVGGYPTDHVARIKLIASYECPIAAKAACNVMNNLNNGE